MQYIKYKYLSFLIVLTFLRPYPIELLGNEVFVKRTIDVIWLLLVLLFYVLVILESGKIKYGKVGLILILFMFVAITSLIYSTFILQKNIAVADFFELYRFFYYFLVFTIGYQLKWTDHNLYKYLYRPILLAFTISATITFLSSISDSINTLMRNIYLFKSTSMLPGLTSVHGGFRIRVSGTFANPNFYGVALNLILPFLLSFYKKSKKGIEKNKYLILIAANIVLILFTGSRTAIFGMVLQLFFAFSLKYINEKITISVTGLAFSCLFIVTGGLFAFENLNRINTTYDTIIERGLLGVESLRIKYNLTKDLFNDVISNSIVLGLGPSQSLDSYLGDNQYGVNFYRYGLLGIFIYFLFWFTIIYKLIKNHYKNKYINLFFAFFLIIYLFFGLTGAFFDATQISTFLFLILGIVLKYNKMKYSKNA